MKTFALATLFLLAIHTYAQNTLPGQLAGLEQALKTKSESLLRAEKMKDVPALKQLLSNDFYQVGSDGKINSRKDFLDDAAEGSLQNYRLYDVQMLSVDENAAILSYNAIIQESEGDESLAPRYEHFSDLWIKNADEWQLRFEQITPRRSID